MNKTVVAVLLGLVAVAAHARQCKPELPGRWDLLFDVSSGGLSERIIHENVLR